MYINNIFIKFNNYFRAELIFIIFISFYFFSNGLLYSEPEKKPNIIFILVDDMGWNALKSYGNTHHYTPNIDRLADEGMRFTQAYVTPECAPTRVELFSGNYSARTNRTVVFTNRVYPKARMMTPRVDGNFPENIYNLSQMLQDVGYVTGISGKWHLGKGYRVAQVKNEIGMDYFNSFGFDFAGSASEGHWDDEIDEDKATMAITEEMIDFIRQNRDNPFFAFLSYFTPHTPLYAPDSLVQKYVNRGYAESTYHMGDTRDIPSAHYIAMIEHLDNAIGRLLEEVDKMSIAEQTMIIFMSDNGASNRAWDNPLLRGDKGMLYEGGIRVPMLVRWPGKVQAGSISETPIAIIDMFPTLQEITNASLPEDKILDGVSLVPLLLGNGDIERNAMYWHHPHYYHDFGKTPNSAIRMGDYKLIHYYGDYLDIIGYSPVRFVPYGKLEVGTKVQLFNIEEDPREEHDLSEKQPAKTKELLDALNSWLKEVDAPMPYENPDFDRSKWYEYTTWEEFNSSK